MKTIRLLSTLIFLAAVLGMITGGSQSVTISGYITDETDSPLPGVSVTVKNSRKTTLSDRDGFYTIQAGKGEKLVFSFVGYQTQEHLVNRTSLNVKLAPDIMILDEMVVVSCDQEEISLPRERKSPDKMAEMSVSAPALRLQAAGIMCDMVYPGGEEYDYRKENRFFSVEHDPLSTFSLDVDGASYSNMRRMVNRGEKPVKESVRVEEFINYFSYDYQKPKGSDPVAITTEVGACPWNTAHRLVRIGVKAKEIASDNLPASNFVFLIDVSGSMYGRLDLVKSSMKLLVNNLRDRDRVAIVVYAGAAGEVLPSTPGSDKQKIREALDKLTAGGSTAGGAGIKLAYNVARNNFIPNGNNRIILCTDGDFNVGVSSAEGLESLIETERKSGVFLTILGYGMGNYKDKKMQVLAEKGNGNHAYIDNMQEANKVLVNEFGSTMYTVAKDVKLQVEFNPAQVKSYRLIGYESRLLNHEDFNDDTKDAGEIGAGHSVTALYEIVPAGIKGNYPGSVDPLKYQPGKSLPPKSDSYSSAELMTVKLRYKAPDGDTSKKIETVAMDDNRKQNSADFNFAAAVAMYGQLVRDSDFKGDATYDRVISLARQGLGSDEHGYRREFIRLAETVKGMN